MLQDKSKTLAQVSAANRKDRLTFNDTDKENIMALKKSFESDESDVGAASSAAAETQAKPSVNDRVAAAAKVKVDPEPEKAAPAASAERAVAAAPSRAVGAVVMAADPFKPLENALTVEWNTLPRVMVTNGGFQNKETQKMMGDEITLEILSIQDHWVVSPGGDINDEEARPFLKYSDDGKLTREGEDVHECVKRAVEAGYTKAALKKRCILVGALVNPGSKAPEMKDDLVQIDLAPNSLRNFNQYRFGIAYKLGKGLVQVDTATVVKIAGLVKSENKMNWTEALFSAA